jgi:DNA repair protein RadA/Sms
MSKKESVFVCQNCGYDSSKWSGRCPSCGEWNTMVETSFSPAPTGGQRKSSRKITPVRANTIKKESFTRLATGINELDRVLGGGIVPGQVALFAGEPGIGKSTLLTQLALVLTQKNKETVFYICGEESPQQIGLRLSRLAGNQQKNDNFLLLPETNVDNIVAFLQKQPSPLLVIVDSIQTLATEDLSGMAGSVGQVRETAQRIIRWAKQSQVPVLIVGHITKQGVIAGPKVLEHAVDTVVYFEGEKRQDLRILRAAKNRFGPTDEVGIFRMSSKGLVAVDDEQLAKSLQQSRVGSALTVVAEGTRMMLVEIQALVTQSFTPLPKRVITGLERNRAEMLISVVQKHLRVPFFKYDIFLNVAQGLRVSEPAADLAICACLLSSFKNKPLPSRSIFVGEVSLLGEVTPVSQLERRKKAASKLGIASFFDHQKITKINQMRQFF